MEKMVIGICDDLQEDRTRLARMLKKCCQELDLEARLLLYPSGKSLLEQVRQPGQMQLLFLDIYMPGLSGMETARRLRARDEDLMIVFATTSTDHGIESFDVYAEDYLVKPFQLADVRSALKWCTEKWTKKRRCLTVYSEGEEQEIPLPVIVYIEILDHRSYIHRTDGTSLMTRRGLDDLECAVNSTDFLRCHRSYLVNMDQIKSVEGDSFRMSDSTLIPISTGNRPQIRSRYLDWLYIKTRECLKGK